MAVAFILDGIAGEFLILKTIVHVVQKMAPGGIETLVLDLALADPHVRVLSLEGDTRSLMLAWPRLAILGDRFVALGKPANLVPQFIRNVMNCLRELNARAVVSHHVGPLLYGGLAARLSGIPVRVHVEHDAWHYDNQRRRRLGWWLGRLIRPRKVAVSQDTARQVSRALANGTMEVIHNGVDLKRFHPMDCSTARNNLGLSDDVRLVGSMGRMVRVKGHDILIAALPFLEPDIHLAFAGDGEERGNLETQARALGVADRVHFLGQQDMPERVYPAFDVFCLPSRSEGFPRALIEAQACNVPVVASDVGGVREAVCPLTGVLVPSEEPQALAKAIQKVIARKTAANPREFVNPHFSFEHTSEAYRRIAA